MQSANEMPRYPLFINGEYCEPESGEYTQVINPATGAVVGEVAMGNEVDVDKAVAVARDTFDNNTEWRRMKPENRCKILKQCAQIILANAQELALLEVTCSGGTLNRVGGMDIMAVVDLFSSLGDAVTSFPFVEALPARPLPELTQTQVWREPVGVCGLITAWNFPLLLLAMKVAPALAAGNTMIVKPAEITPTSTVRFVELLNTILPKGVLNVVVGAGSVVGEALSLHKDVDKISFTGSTSIGRHVQQNAAQTMKRVTLELGGKGPGIVMPDADIERVAYGALWGVYMNAGQACESGTRLIVHEDIYDDVIQRLKEVSEDVVVGDPMDPATGMGPMSTESHFNKVMSYIESAVADGAQIITGGKRADVPGCEGGFFVEPTIIAGVKNDMKVACEEIFGPVLSVIKYSTLEEAIAIANDSDYGLSAGVWTENVVKAQQIARDLRAGSVWINDWHMMRTDAPFGGYKQSGYGREFGKYSISSYVETKTVSTSFERNPAAKKMHKIVHTKLA